MQPESHNLQLLSRRLATPAATINAEGHRTVFVVRNPLDQQVPHPSITQIVDERVAETVECRPGVGDAELGLVLTEPLVVLPPTTYRHKFLPFILILDNATDGQSLLRVAALDDAFRAAG